jgi:mono/diheme cytochrome c family protein
MAEWSKDNAETLKKTENADSLKALVEFVVAQSGRDDFGPFDQNLVVTGKEIFKGGKLFVGSLTANCSDCHALKAADGTESLGDGAGAGYPTLTGYAGKAWLKSFVTNPAQDSFYGNANNLMPAFESKLSDKDLSHIINWLVGEYFQEKKQAH